MNNINTITIELPKNYPNSEGCSFPPEEYYPVAMYTIEQYHYLSNNIKRRFIAYSNSKEDALSQVYEYLYNESNPIQGKILIIAVEGNPDRLDYLRKTWEREKVCE